MLRWCIRTVMLTALAGVGTAAVASADTWNEKTILTFSEAIAVPGATLQPGTYVFRIADVNSARHVLRVLSEDERRVIAAFQAVPMKRQQTTNDIVLTFEPAQSDAPALRGFFYPGRLYGHEFVYSDDEAKQIAARSKTVVLSTEDEGTDVKRGTLHTVDAAGVTSAWRDDPAVSREWTAWQQERGRAGGQASDAREQRPGASASMITADFKGMRVELDDLEDQPSQYTGQRISVDGEVDDVLGPRLFKIDEPSWGDLEGELLVIVPIERAALVREGDRVTVSGTVRTFARADVEQEWGWLGLDPAVEGRVSQRPVIVAQRVVGGDETRALLIRAPNPEGTPVGTSGVAGLAVSGSQPLTNATTLATGDDELIGRNVDLAKATVTGVAAGRGFFIGPRERQLFVLTEHADRQQQPTIGQEVAVDGFVMQMPSGMPRQLQAAGALNRHIYLYATSVE